MIRWKNAHSASGSGGFKHAPGQASATDCPTCKFGTLERVPAKPHLVKCIDCNAEFPAANHIKPAHKLDLNGPVGSRGKVIRNRYESDARQIVKKLLEGDIFQTLGKSAFQGEPVKLVANDPELGNIQLAGYYGPAVSDPMGREHAPFGNRSFNVCSSKGISDDDLAGPMGDMILGSIDDGIGIACQRNDDGTVVLYDGEIALQMKEA
jgi:hypothetical protein